VEAITMNVHNIMESIVLDTVNEIFEDKRKEGFEMADCLQCRLDVACYVLNRIKPEYIISGRGLLHFEENYHELIQTKVDLVTLINTGIKKISNTKRSYYDSEETNKNVTTRYVFNFPSIIGTVLTGDNFVPVENLIISLLMENTPAKMIDNTWQNPFTIVKSTKGNYTFMPAPVASNNENEERNFQFEIRIENTDFEVINHFFEIHLISEKSVITTFSMGRTHKLENLYLFTKDSE
jgi:competence protein ComFB